MSLSVTIATLNYAPEQTGIAAYTTSLAKGLAARGHDVTVLTAPPHYPAWRVAEQGAWSDDEVIDGVRLRRVRSYVPARPNFVTRAAFEILFGLKLAAQPIRADVVLLVSPGLFTSLLVRAKLRALAPATPTVLWLQDRYSAGMREISGAGARLAAGAIRVLESMLARSCDAVVVIHERWREEVSKDLGVEASRISAIRNWTHIRLPREVDEAATRHRLGWGARGDEVVVLHSGNMGAKQGLESVVEAAGIAEREGLGLRFVLMGDGNQRARLEGSGQGCSRLQFLPPLDPTDYLEALVAADILLVNELPGLRETAVPSKLTSYFAAGRPVLAATDAVSVTADEVRASGAGRIITAGDPRTLTQQALALAATSDLRDNAGPSFVREVLSEAAGIDAFECLLLAVASQFSTSPEPPSSPSPEGAAR